MAKVLVVGAQLDMTAGQFNWLPPYDKGDLPVPT